MVDYSEQGACANKAIYDKIVKTMTWASGDMSIPINKSDVIKAQELVDNASEIEKNLADEYKKRIMNRRDGTENTVFLRLRQLHDEAKLISAAFLSTMSRDQIMGFK